MKTNNLRKTIFWSAVFIAATVEFYANNEKQGFTFVYIASVIIPLIITFYYAYYKND